MELKLLYLKHYKLFQKKLRVEKQLGCVFFLQNCILSF